MKGLGLKSNLAISLWWHSCSNKCHLSAASQSQTRQTKPQLQTLHWWGYGFFRVQLCGDDLAGKGEHALHLSALASCVNIVTHLISENQTKPSMTSPTSWNLWGLQQKPLPGGVTEKKQASGSFELALHPAQLNHSVKDIYWWSFAFC